MSQYLVLIYEDEQAWENADPPTVAAIMADHRTFGQRNAAAIRGGAALHPTGTATSIREDGAGGFLVTDGPFVESKEALGGYYVVEAPDLDGALAIARSVPAPFGGVEVRPLRPSVQNYGG
jgi:hypothetical protein